jgi:hypothetical protein
MEVTVVTANEFDWDFRPEQYWDSPDAAMANIKGTFRRGLIQGAAESGVLDAMPTGVFGNDVSEADRIAMGRAMPGADSGEYLPEYKQEEVEVVRFTLSSTLCDVISIRARPCKGRITWRLVQDNPWGVMRLSRRVSKEPMTFHELTDMLDNIKCEWGPDWITESWRDVFIDGTELEDIPAWIMIESCFYPELEAWFANRVHTWVAEKEAEQLADE